MRTGRSSDTGDTRAYLGIVLPIDGLGGLQRRHATASEFLSDFGVAMYCGFGPGRATSGTVTKSTIVQRLEPTVEDATAADECSLR